MKQSKYRVTVFFGAVAAVCLLIGMLLTSLEYVCYHDFAMYQEEYEKYNVLADLPAGVRMNGENSLMSVTRHMMKYLIGDKETPGLQTTIETADGIREFFVERELLHMADCRVLFQKALQIRYICIFFAIFLFFYGRYAIIRERGLFLAATGRGLLIGATVFFAGALVLTVYILTNFDRAFVQFHEIFFHNDLWLLDPRESLLINILPQGFFYDVAKATLQIFLPATALLIAAAAWLDRKNRDTTGKCFT